MEPPLALHHVGYVTKLIEPAAAAYVERFGYLVASPILHDPLQTAFVQFLHLPGDRVYLEFVAPDGPESKLANASQKRPGLNHLCYTTDNLEQAIEHFEQTGLRLIAEPKPGFAFANRRICWLLGQDSLPIELVERRDPDDLCLPGIG